MNKWHYLRRFFPEKQQTQPSEAQSAAAPAEHVHTSLQENEAWANQTFRDCDDVIRETIHIHEGQGAKLLLVYSVGLADASRINQTIIPSLRNFLRESYPQPLDAPSLLNQWSISSLEPIEYLDNLVLPVFQGHLVIFIDGIASAFSLDISNPPNRKPEEASTENTIRGPRDAFIEDLSINVALVRKRLPTSSLCFELYHLGRRSRTKTGLLYIKDIIRPDVVAEVQRRLANIDMDAVFSSNELEELLAEAKWSLFPQFEYTGRPDHVVASLLRGRFAILLDGVPTAIIAPTNLTLVVKSSEDLHSSYAFVAFGRLLRMLGLCISLFLPAFYLSFATHHQDQLPLSMLATIVMSRKGTPLPTPIECLIMLFMFELFREAGMRLPSMIGQTLTVVGGLIIGDAAIRAGLTSATLLVVIGTAAVATFSLVNQTLVGAVSILRVLISIVTAFLGLFGFLLSVFAILVYLANLRSFGIPYLAPISPINMRDFVHSLFRAPASKIQKRPDILDTRDSTRRGNSN
ncbi:spore germination protein [Brevibacillus marinus]|uniref:spore germination protein n=1 Tax=Brevibacillus marinus TaxID=2496837 RepID=UPI000F844925|nr:spore germination protein [Brevibacillus marinus]